MLLYLKHRTVTVSNFVIKSESSDRMDFGSVNIVTQLDYI